MIYRKLSDISKKIDHEQYAESCCAIENIIDNEGNLYSNPFEIACILHESDETEIMPQCITDLVIGIYLEEINNGNAEAMTNLGSLYYTGRCGEQNYEKAVKYYKMADEHGERQATENLGYCYYYGRNVAVDYEKAFHYFVKGALDGHLNSLYKIGDMYRNGYYVKKDEAEAFCIYSRCYEEMTDECYELIGADICLRMGDVYFYAIGTEQRLETALKFYQEAERCFYKRIKNGDYFSRKGFRNTIEKQDKIRRQLCDDLPSFEWSDAK